MATYQEKGYIKRGMVDDSCWVVILKERGEKVEDFLSLSFRALCGRIFYWLTLGA